MPEPFGPIPAGFAYVGELRVDELQPADFIEALDEKSASLYLRGYVEEVSPKQWDNKVKITLRPIVGNPLVFSRYRTTRVHTWRPQ